MRLQTALLARANKEESSEFAGLRSATGPAERSAMAAALRLRPRWRRPIRTPGTSPPRAHCSWGHRWP